MNDIDNLLLPDPKSGLSQSEILKCIERLVPPGIAIDLASRNILYEDLDLYAKEYNSLPIDIRELDRFVTSSNSSTFGKQTTPAKTSR